MSTVPDTEQGRPGTSETATKTDHVCDEVCDQTCDKRRKKSRNVCFPDDGELVTQYFEPANPWQHVPSTSRAQLAAEYLESCRRHNTPPIDTVLQQIRELPENAIGGGNRAPRLSLAECSLCGAAPVDALEALLRKVQFRRIEVDHAEIDDEGAEALFDMIEYYESAMVVCLSGPRQFGIRGWQAASRMIKQSAELSELEITESGLEASHAPVVARALKPHTCRLRSLCLQRAVLCGEPLLCLVIALKSNTSIRELRLGDNSLTVSDAAQLASLLRLNTSIHLLDLSNNQIQDAGAGHIAEALVDQAAQTPPSVATSPMSPHHCPLTGGHETRGLAFLVLWNNQLTRNCAQHLSKALRSSPSLCVLNVGRNALGGDTVRALQGAGGLVSLGLQAARLGPEAAKAVAELIRHDTTLQRLDLRDNRLGSSGLQAILNAMKENTTLTQIDLDDTTESSNSLSSDDAESASIARLTREIRALCRRNEPDATSPERRVHRKISLTCNTTCLVRTPLCMEDERRSSRLRSPLPSPAPSPAGSPVPLQHSHSRFSVTRVTPDRDSSTDSSSPTTPTRPTYCPTPSRFKVMQVAEPPQIQVHPASSEPRKSLSRFSVTRNYDKMYNPSPSPSPVPSSESDTPAEDICDDDSDKDRESDDKDLRRVGRNDKERSEVLKESSQSGSDIKHVDVVKTVSDSSRTDAQTISERTVSDKFSVNAVSDSAEDSRHNLRLSSGKRFSVSAVDNLEPSSKPGRKSKRFSVSSVKETDHDRHSRFSTSLVDNAKSVSSHSDTENVSNNERTKSDSTSEAAIVNINPLDSEISKRFSVNVPEVNQESSSANIAWVSNPDLTHSITTPVSSKTRLKSCMRSSESSRQSTSRSSDDVRCLKRENSEANEVLSSHPNLKSISDLFKSLEVYGNTADNTVSLTSLSESKRPSVRDIFDTPESKGKETVSGKEADVPNIKYISKNVATCTHGNVTDLTNKVVDIATQSSEMTHEQASSNVLELSQTLIPTDNSQIRSIGICTDDNNQYVVDVSDVESHHNRSIDVSTNDDLHQLSSSVEAMVLTAKPDLLQSKVDLMTTDERSHQSMKDVCVQTDDFDIVKVLTECDRVSLLDANAPRIICEDNANKIIHQTPTVHSRANRSESEDVLETIFETNKEQSADEGFSKAPNSERVVTTSVAKSVPECADIGTILHERSAGSTPHPSKGVRTFVLPEFHVENEKETSNIDRSCQVSHLSKFPTDISAKTEELSKVDDGMVLVQTKTDKNTETDSVINKYDLIKDKHANEKVIYVSIEDEFPVFDPKPIKTNVPSSVLSVKIEQEIEIDKYNVPDLAHSNILKVLEMNEQSTNSVSKLIHKVSEDIDVFEISKNLKPTFLPDEIFVHETESLDDELLKTELKSLKNMPMHSEISDFLTKNIDITKKLPHQTDVIVIQKDNLPGATQPTLVSEIPIYSISQLSNMPGTSKALFVPRDVTTQTDLSEIDDISESLKSVHIDSLESTDSPMVLPDVLQSRLTLEGNLCDIAEISRNIKIEPMQTELSIKESKYSSVLPEANSTMPGIVSNIKKIDFTSIIGSDSNIHQGVNDFLEEFSKYKSGDWTELKILDNVENKNITEDIVDVANQHRNVSSKDSVCTDINISGVKQRDKEIAKRDNDTLIDTVRDPVTYGDCAIQDTVNISDTMSNQIVPEILVSKNISDTDLNKNIDDVSELQNVSDDKIFKKAGLSSCNIKTVEIDSIHEKGRILDENSDKTVGDSNKSDQYKDVSQELTHSETKNAGVVKSETQIVKNTIEITDEEKIDVEVKMTIKKENLETKTYKIQNVVKKEDPLKQIELITKGLGDLIDDMRIGTVDRDKKDCVRATQIEIDKERKVETEADLQKVEVFQDQTRRRDIINKESKEMQSSGKNIGTVSHRNEFEIIRDIKETEFKYLRDHEETFEKHKYFERSSLKDRLIDSHSMKQSHIPESDRYRKETVIYSEDTDDSRKEFDRAVRKEMKDKLNIKESVLKKNKSESSLDSSDMEVSRFMTKHINPFCDSSSSLEISGSSIESLTEPKLIITKDHVDSDIELDRRKEHTLSTGSSVESTEVTPMNTNLLNLSVSSNESVSPIFGKIKNIRDSLSSLEASVSSIESTRQDRVMVTSADSGIEHSLPKDIQESSSNEGTLTNPLNIKHDTLTASPKRASSLLDVPALKSKGLDKMRKISWVAPSSSFNVARQDDKEVKPSHLEKLLSLFQHPSSIFSRSSEEEKKISTPPKKDSLLTSSFWSWGSGERDKDDSSEATDSTLSERVQVSFVDESFSRKLDSKTPSTDTENTLSEFQTFTQSEKECDVDTYKVTHNTTDKNVVQIDLSLKCTEASNGNKKVSNSLDVVSPNDFNKNYDTNDSCRNTENSPDGEDIKRDEKDVVRPRSFAAVLKASGSENSLEKQNSPEGHPVDKLPSKVIRGIKENISPENTLTSSMSNTKALALELSERQVKTQPVVNTVWELTNPLEKVENKDLAPIATIEETCDETADIIQLAYIDDDKAQKEVDVAKDALSYLIYENQAFDQEQKSTEIPGQSSLADELKEAHVKEMFDLSPELIIDEAIEVPEVFIAKDVIGMRTSPIIPERAKLKKSNSLEDISIEDDKHPKAKTIAFKVPESKPRDIPERSKLRSRSGSSPKSLPESLNKPCPLTKIEASRKKKKVSSLGKMAKDSLLALNMSEDEIADFRRSYKLTSVESLRSLESVSEDANSQSGNSVDSRCRACLRTSQESLMSLDSITEDICRCGDSDKPSKSNR